MKRKRRPHHSHRRGLLLNSLKDVTKQNMKVVWEDVSESLKIPYLENTCPLIRGAKLVRPLTEDGAAPPAIRKILDKVKKRKQEAEGGEGEAKKPRE